MQAAIPRNKNKFSAFVTDLQNNVDPEKAFDGRFSNQEAGPIIDALLTASGAITKNTKA